MEMKFEAVRKYNIQATIDEDVWGNERLEEFSTYFHDVTQPKEILDHVIHNVIMFGSNTFVEGVGYVMVNGFNYGEYIKEIRPSEEPLIDNSIKIVINDPFPDIERIEEV